LCRGTSKARRHIEDRVAVEEVTRSKKQSHRLSRHDRVVFRGGEMGQTESMPENDIRVIDRAVRASGFNPSWETF
jgi:hypothetical protein